MKQLGNLAIVCAQKKGVLFQVQDGEITILLECGAGKKEMQSAWDDDTKISDMIHVLNFGTEQEAPK